MNKKVEKKINSIHKDKYYLDLQNLEHDNIIEIFYEIALLNDEEIYQLISRKINDDIIFEFVSEYNVKMMIKNEFPLNEYFRIDKNLYSDFNEFQPFKLYLKYNRYDRHIIIEQYNKKERIQFYKINDILKNIYVKKETKKECFLSKIFKYFTF